MKLHIIVALIICCSFLVAVSYSLTPLPTKITLAPTSKFINNTEYINYLLLYEQCSTALNNYQLMEVKMNKIQTLINSTQSQLKDLLKVKEDQELLYESTVNAFNEMEESKWKNYTGLSSDLRKGLISKTRTNLDSVTIMEQFLTTKLKSFQYSYEGRNDTFNNLTIIYNNCLKNLTAKTTTVKDIINTCLFTGTLQTLNEIPSENALCSVDKRYRVAMQLNGNLELLAGDTVIWTSNSKGIGVGPYRVVLQGDGNLVIWDSKKKAIWASGTAGFGQPFYHLVMQNDRNLVLYDAYNVVAWSTNTYKAG